MGHMGSAMNGQGYSLNSLVGGLLVFSIKLLMIVLVIAFIAGIFVWIKNNFPDNHRQQAEKKPLIHSVHNDPIIQMTTWTTLAVIGFVLLYALFIRSNQNGMMGMNQYSMDFFMNSSSIYGITALLILLAKLLMGIFAISLIMAAIVYIKTQYERGNINFGNTNKKNQSQIVNIESDGKMTTDLRSDQTTS